MDCVVIFQEAPGGAVVAQLGVSSSVSCSAGDVARAIGWLDPSAASLYQMPTSGELAQAWGVGFLLPCTLYLVAYAVGSVVRMWDK